MNTLRAEEKLKIVRELCDKHKITAYEIGEKTNLDTSGVQRILNGETKKPREKTLDVILNFLEETIVGNVIPNHINYKIPQYPHITAEESEKYGKDVQKIISMLRDIQVTMRQDHDVMADGISKIYLNTEDIRDGNMEMSSSITNLITTLNKGSRGKS